MNDQERPTDPPEGTIDIPDGGTVLNDLPHDLAQELIEDELQKDHKPSNRSYIAEIVRLAGFNQMSADLRAGMLIRTCIESAGESECAIQKWLEIQE